MALALFVGVVWARLGIEGQNGEENQLPEDAAELPGVTNEWWAVVKETYLQSKQDSVSNTGILTGTGEFLPATPDWMAEGNQGGAEFGFPAISVGGLNGDNYDDIVIGARFFNSGDIDEGRVYVFYGSATGLSTTPDWTADGNRWAALYGQAANSAGDVGSDE